MEITLSRTVSDFYLDNSFVSLIIGPIGSGKTMGCIAKLERLMHEQEPNHDGIRYSRWVIVRNTYQELKDTTIKSFEGFFGDLVKFNWGNLTALYKNDDIHAEFLFRSLDKPGDMRKLLSLEITGAYLNELRELPKDALTNVTSRLGRYPYPKDGPGSTKQLCIADSNAFPDDHWLYRLFLTSDKPKNFSLFLQPPALLDDGTVNPEAENLKHLPYEYYRGQLAGKPKDWIDVMIKVKFIAQKVGLPVYPEFNQAIHIVNQEELQEPSTDRPLICGADNGRWSGFLIGQQDALGRLVIFDELVSEDINLTEFSEIIRSHMQKNYPKHKLETWIDPWAANQRGQLTDATMFKVYNKKGLAPRVTHTKRVDTMIEAVKKKLGQLIVGEPSILISNKCKTLIRGLNGGYAYRRINVSGERYAEKPDKGPFSHICNALEFLVDGSGATLELLASNRYTDVIQVKSDWNVL